MRLNQYLSTMRLDLRPGYDVCSLLISSIPVDEGKRRLTSDAREREEDQIS
jgi:hypothetical protein